MIVLSQASLEWDVSEAGMVDLNLIFMEIIGAIYLIWYMIRALIEGEQ